MLRILSAAVLDQVVAARQKPSFIVAIGTALAICIESSDHSQTLRSHLPAI